MPFAARFDPSGVYQLDAALPLAFRRPSLRVAKGDQFDNKRAADPENYAVTDPPARPAIRPMTEWEPMRALLLAFPAYASQLEQATDTFVGIARHASDYGEVWVVVDGSQAESIFKQQLIRAGVPDDKLGTSIKFWRAPIDTYWFIDYGPLPLIDSDAAAGTESFAFGDFRYYHDRPLDDALPTLLGRALPALGETLAVTTYRMPLTTEGGTLQATSDGVCITGSRQIYNMSCEAGGCRESILALSLPELQSHPYAVEMRGLLATYAGCNDLIVTHSVSDDGTGHLDMYLKILDDERILLGEYRAPFESSAAEDNAVLMDDNAAFLEAYVKPDGGRFQVVRLPMPGHRTVEDFFGTYDVPFTYINATFFNGLNLWPGYTFREWIDSRHDAEAIWKQVLPDMEHVWIDSEELSYQSGAIHCVTRTLPLKKAVPWVDDGACESGTCSNEAGGYDGQCSLAGASDLCWGPGWLCGCNDCRDCPEVVPDAPCGSVGWRGCCDSGDVLFCDSDALRRLPCVGTGCGWDSAQGFYTCGLAGEDPSGSTPISCACVPACDGKSCGDDGCGGSCGTCDAGALCVAGQCREDCASCLPGEMGCEGAVSWRCVEGAGGCHREERVDCAASGFDCDAGDCVAVHSPDPDPEDTTDADADPGPETGETSATTDGGPDGVSDSGATAGPRAVSGSADGCAGSGPTSVTSTTGPLLLLPALLLLLLRRRQGGSSSSGDRRPAGGRLP